MKRNGIALATGLVAVMALAPMARLSLADETYGDRIARIEALSPEQKAKLIQKRERFEALSPQERDNLRQLHQQIAIAPNSQRLLGVLDRYNEWLKTLSLAEQAELMGLPIAERLAKIKEIQQAQAQTHFWDLAGRLEKEDLDTIYAWMEDFASRHEAEILTKVDPRSAGQIVSTPNPRNRRYLLVRTVFGFRRPQTKPPLPTPTEDDFKALAAQLSLTLQYELAMQKSDENRRGLVMTCARFALMSRYAPPPPNDEQLSEFYAKKLSPKERERVEKLEPSQMKRELTNLYNRQRFRDGVGGWRPPGVPGEPGPPFGPPPGEGRSRRDGGSDHPPGPENGRGGKAKVEPSEKS